MDNIKAYISGFHYGVKHFETLEDKHFHTYFRDLDKSGHYRNGIKFARNYMLYRYEILTLFLISTTMIIFAVTW